MRDGVREGVWEFWMKCEGLRGSGYLVKSNGAFCIFFFFFFFEFRPDSAVAADTDQVGLIWAASAPISAASA